MNLDRSITIEQALGLPTGSLTAASPSGDAALRGAPGQQEPTLVERLLGLPVGGRTGNAGSSAIVALRSALPLGAGEPVQLLPAGEFSARDGRPGPGMKWRLSNEQGAVLAAEVSRMAAITPLVIDYEHQTLNAVANGKPAPAAGWITSASWVSDVGLFGEVEWTAAAKAAIAAAQYRFISPVIRFEADGRVSAIEMAALTNYPALLGMRAIAPLAGAALVAAGAYRLDLRLNARP